MTTAATKTRIRVKDNGLRGFESPREFFGSVAQAYGTGRVDDRLRPLAAAGSDEHNTLSDSHGGFLLPEAIHPNVYSTFSGDPIAGRVTTFDMQQTIEHVVCRTDQNHSTSPVGGLSVGRKLETQAISTSRMQMERIKYEAQTLIGLAYATEELFARSAPSIAMVLEMGFSDAMTHQLLTERLFGTGVEEYEGVVNAGCVIAVAKESMQSADTINSTNIIKMRERCWRYDQAVWLAHPNTYDQLVACMVESSTPAGVIPLYSHSTDETQPDTLAGRPVLYSEYCKTLGDNGDLILGNWSQYAEGILERGNSQSVHVRFLNHERAFKFWVYSDGHPLWRTAITPVNGSDTLSPFVTLAERA